MNTTDTPNTKPRPTGMSVGDYARYTKWSFRRWAWEFLRRNSKFIAACRNAGDNPDLQNKVAAEFHLKRFKKYTERYTGLAGRPVFLSAAVSSWSNVDGERVMRPNPELRGGQVLVRFDLSETTEDREAIAAQLRAATALVINRQKAYLANRRKAEPRPHASKPIYFLRSLRLLDLLDGKINQHRESGRALRIVNQAPNARTEISDREARERYKKQIPQARALAAEGYRHLANRAGAPEAKNFK